MRDWVPVSSSPKGRLALRALEEFVDRRFDEVTVGEIAARAGVTTGPLYHHFGSKLGLYGFVRDEAERRLLDRMEGAASARADEGLSAALRGALLVGFDFAVSQGFSRLLGEPHPSRDVDPGRRTASRHRRRRPHNDREDSRRGLARGTAGGR